MYSKRRTPEEKASYGKEFVRGYYICRDCGVARPLRDLTIHLFPNMQDEFSCKDSKWCRDYQRGLK